MNDPKALSLTALLGAMLGPLAGQYTAVFLMALLGGFWALSAAPTSSRSEGALFLIRVVLTACAFAGFAEWALEHYTVSTRNAPDAPAVLAFLIAYSGDRWRRLVDRLLGRLEGLIDRDRGSNSRGEKDQ